MNLMVFDSHMPNVDKYFIVMDQLSNPFGVMDLGSAQLLCCSLSFGDLEEPKALEVSGKFSVSGWKDQIYGGNTSLVMFGKGG